MPRYRVLIEYDGAMFAGWQRQAGQSTIQSALETALSKVLREPISIFGSGRTDAGVHARAQAAHFDIETEFEVGRMVNAVNGWLRAHHDGAIVVLLAERAPDGFHARYDAMQRTYHYLATGRPRAIDRTRRWSMRPEPDWELMNRCAEMLLGTHHFGSFCITTSSTENRVCTVEQATWLPEDRPGDWRFVITANRFLHGMVRAIVGTLAKIGQGRVPPDALSRILEGQDRRLAGPAAPPNALYLAKVTYADGFGQQLMYSSR